MLELRPICENCAKDLPPDSQEARICSYECTFCTSCAEGLLGGVCPNCGGGFVQRPIRPKKEWRSGISLSNQPAVAQKKHRPVDMEEHASFSTEIKKLSPLER